MTETSSSTVTQPAYAVAVTRPACAVAVAVARPAYAVATVAIIGTAGRKDDADKLDAKLFEHMVECAERIIVDGLGQSSWSSIRLVSGGAAGADHVAVRLFQRHAESGLCLHLPAEWKDGQACDTGENDWRTNPGRTMNQLHKAFSKRVGCDSLKEIADAKGATIVSHQGFHARNTHVAKANYLIAFTFGESWNEPKDGGTMDTWKKFRGRHKIHVPLGALLQMDSMDRVLTRLFPLRALRSPVAKRSATDAKFANVDSSDLKRAKVTPTV